MSSLPSILCRGYFTTLGYLKGLDARELERAVGFDRDRLAQGFSLIALADDEVLTPSDVELKASSRWSAGAVGGKQGVGGKQIESILLQREQDVTALKAKVCEFFSRRGNNTPAKVLPNLRHTSGMIYPDAEALGPGISSGVPQFDLLVPKRFVILLKQ